MHQIPCPWCGTRDESEFSYQGDASCRIAAPLDRSQEELSELVYFRQNPKGFHREYWHHVAGCRQFLVVERHTLTHEIKSSQLARPEPSQPAPAGEVSK